MKVIRSLFLLVGIATLAACTASPDQGVVPVTSAPVQSSAPAKTFAPAPTISKSFSVYFDINKADIRASAMQILYEAAQVAKATKPVTIRVHGYADASGKASYNQILSERRASAVADQLRKLGLTVAIETRGLGEGKSKSREDRRVEVVLEGIAPQDASIAKVGDQIASAAFSPANSVSPDLDGNPLLSSLSGADPAPSEVVVTPRLHVANDDMNAVRSRSRAPPGRHIF